MYGFDRLVEVTKETVNLGAEETKEEIIKDLRKHISSAPVEDDVTLMIVDFN